MKMSVGWERRGGSRESPGADGTWRNGMDALDTFPGNLWGGALCGPAPFPLHMSWNHVIFLGQINVSSAHLTFPFACPSSEALAQCGGEGGAPWGWLLHFHSMSSRVERRESPLSSEGACPSVCSCTVPPAPRALLHSSPQSHLP